jgi:hypothetical protein
MGAAALTDLPTLANFVKKYLPETYKIWLVLTQSNYQLQVVQGCLKTFNIWAVKPDCKFSTYGSQSRFIIIRVSQNSTWYKCLFY